MESENQFVQVCGQMRAVLFQKMNVLQSVLNGENINHAIPNEQEILEAFRAISGAPLEFPGQQDRHALILNQLKKVDKHYLPACVRQNEHDSYIAMEELSKIVQELITFQVVPRMAVMA